MLIKGIPNLIYSMQVDWGLLSLVSTIEELLERRSSGSGLEIREYGSKDLSL
jgi:hypothetical protein